MTKAIFDRKTIVNVRYKKWIVVLYWHNLRTEIIHDGLFNNM